MSMKHVAEYEFIPGKGADGKVVGPNYTMATDISDFGKRLGFLASESATLAQLRRACEYSSDIRSGILLNGKGHGEAIRAAIGPLAQKPKSLVVPLGCLAVTYCEPEKFEYVKECNWHFEGERSTKILQPSGWQGADGGVMYDDDGFPVKTYPTREEAIDSILKASLTDDKGEARKRASYFHRRDRYREVVVLCRHHMWDDYGPWHLIAYWKPQERIEWIGGRKTEVTTNLHMTH